MPLETATYISDLNASNPIGATDPLSSADDHLRLIKLTLKNTFPNITGVVSATQGQLNNLNSLAALSVLANATGGAAAPAALSASANNQVLARIAGALVFSADYPQLSASNTFTGVNQIIQPLLDSTFPRLTISDNVAARMLEVGYCGATSGGVYGAPADATFINSSAAASGGLVISTSDAARITISAAGVISLNGVNPTDFARLSQANAFTQSGAGGVVQSFANSNAGAAAFVTARLINDAGRNFQMAYASSGSTGLGFTNGPTAEAGYIYTSGAFPISIGTSGTEALRIDSAQNFNFRGGTVTTNNVSASEVGYKGTPPNVQNGNYGIVLADAGCGIFKQSGAGNTITIPANGTIALPIGTVITIDNDSGNSVSIAITTDVLELAGAGTTGTRTLADNGSCTLQKIAATKWRISGAGVS